MKKAAALISIITSLVILSGCASSKSPESGKTACGCPEGCGCTAKSVETCTCSVHNPA